MIPLLRTIAVITVSVILFFPETGMANTMNLTTRNARVTINSNGVSASSRRSSLPQYRKSYRGDRPSIWSEAWQRIQCRNGNSFSQSSQVSRSGSSRVYSSQSTQICR